MFKWLHHLFNPHCPDCIRVCDSCETLRSLLNIEKNEKQKLLDIIIERNTPKEHEVPPEVKLEDITQRHIPWRVRQQALEAEDRAKARILKQRTEELEQEIGIGTGTNS